MARLVGEIDTKKGIQLLIVGVILLWVTMQFIDFGAIGKEDADLFKAPPEDIVPQAFKWIIIGGAAWLTWTLVLGAGQKFDRKKLITLVIFGVALFFLYDKVLVPLLPDVLPDIGSAAVKLQSIVRP